MTGPTCSAGAAAAGINILPGSVFSPSGQYASCIRIACGHPADVMQRAVVTIAGVLAKIGVARSGGQTRS